MHRVLAVGAGPGNRVEIAVPDGAGTAARRVFPFGFGGQPAAGPLAISGGLIPGHSHDGIFLAFLVWGHGDVNSLGFGKRFKGGHDDLGLPHPESFADLNGMRGPFVLVAFLVAVGASHAEDAGWDECVG